MMSKHFKRLIFSGIFACATTWVAAQSAEEPPKNWFNLDPKTDKVNGVSTEKSYQELLKGKPSQTVIVAIIDSGVDIEHEDLKDKIWKNPREIPNNGIDDDGNGYIDDVHGWNFIGGKDGKHVNQDTYEFTRIYVKFKNKFEGKKEADISPADKKDYELFLKAKKIYEKKWEEYKPKQEIVNTFYVNFQYAKKLLEAYWNTEKLTMEMLEETPTKDVQIERAKNILMQSYSIFGSLDESKLKEYKDYIDEQVNYNLNMDFDPRSIVGDNYEDNKERFYGNNDVKGPDAKHGTHVAGIVAAKRGNGIGMEGVAENVRIMPIRAIPNGDERDKDVANAIRYAVDNGAKVINMSFGKSFSPEKEIVDEAIRYAEQKGVLLIHAAGNDSENIDEGEHYPRKESLNERKNATHWIEVGALSWKGGEDVVGNFSNFGKKSVDVFSPGVDIYSTTPENTYQSLNGTSMAAPVTAGIAAVLFSYYPHLTAVQVRDIILKSTIKMPNLKVKKPGAEEGDALVNFGDLSVTGGVVNLYEAIKLAESIKPTIPKR
ncbi:MAG: S8 family peptidase [Thermoflexibacter sp.]